LKPIDDTKAKVYDLIVIGGGPAGMMTAGIAALQKEHPKVLLLEKNPSLGKKLLITGKGRCNITTADTDINNFVEILGKQGKFLYSALSQFDIQATIKFFNDTLGIKTKVERGNRVFPASDSSREVLEKLTKFLRANNVEILLNTKVKKLNVENGKIVSVDIFDKKVHAKNFVIATGGLSYPATGSTGDGFLWLKKIGHKITNLYPALTPLKCKEEFVKDLEGLSLKNVSVSVFDSNNKKIIEKFGEALFTDDGMSGPIILDISAKIVDLIGLKKLKLVIDFKSAISEEQLDKRLQREFLANSNKIFKNSLDDLLPKKLIPVIVELSKIEAMKSCNNITKTERQSLLNLLKKFELTIFGFSGFEKAIITKGGVSLKEINPKNMQSKLIPNLFFAGEILDLNASTGGYNLQVCWTTGHIAGINFYSN
jgi:hypothetical protein